MSPNILCFQETWLQEHQTPKLKGYQPPNRYNRQQRVGGGTLIWVKQGIPTTPIKLNTTLEICANKLYLENKTITLCSLYLPPDLDNKILEKSLSHLHTQLEKPYMICMDANAHHMSWGSNFSDKRGHILNDWINDNQLTVLNTDEPTYQHSNGNYSHIDITITSNDLSTISDWKPYTDNMHSDHFPIQISIDIESPNLKIPIRWDLKKADWDKYQNQVKLPSQFHNPTSACQQVIDAIINAADTSIPKTKDTINPKYSNIWWTEKCKRMKKEKNIAHNEYKRDLGNMEKWIKYKQAQAKERFTILEAKKESWREYVSSLNSTATSQEIWNKVRAIKGKNMQKTITLKNNNKIITNSTEVADELAEYYANQATEIKNPFFVAHKAAREKRNMTFSHTTNSKYNRNFNVKELNQAINKCTKTSAGPDTISFALIQNIPKEEQKNLLKFYNYIWNNGFPNQWRESILVPILKPQKNSNNKESYRPIALTNCLCKIAERMINMRLQLYLEENKVLKDYQSGFRMAHSTIDPLIRIEGDIRCALRNKQHCIAVFLDITKAFDSVCHRELLEILQEIGLHGNLPKFIEGFLDNRTFRVRINNSLSKAQNFQCGVPQGSILSPTLFSLMINTLFETCPQEVNYSLYADDGALWIRTSSMAEGMNLMQQALDETMQFSNTKGLQLSPSKTKAMVFTYSSKKLPHPLSLNGEPIQYTTNIKFLGMTLDRRLTWKAHIQQLVDRSQKDLRLLRVVSSCNWGADLPTIRKLYLSILRSKLEYGDLLYATAAPTLLKKLDRVQYNAARIILGALRCTTTNSLEAEANLMPLNILRRKNAVKYGSRILNVESHIVGNLIRGEPYPQMVPLPNKPQPAIILIKKEFTNLKISTAQIPTVPLEARMNNYNSPCYLTLKICSKGDMNPGQWSHQFNVLVKEKYTGYTQIYCDGSVGAGTVGSGVWSETFQLMSRLHNSASILTAELFAIFIALNYLNRVARKGKYVIFTDSINSILLLQNPLKNQNYLIYKIITLFDSFDENTLAIEWVPSHSNIKGNDNADGLAKKATKLPNQENQYIPHLDMKRLIGKHYDNLWQKQWEKSPSKLLTIKQQIGMPEYTSLPRNTQIKYTRLRLNTTLLTHKHYFTKEQHPECTHCKEKQTIKHIIEECSEWSVERSILRAACASAKVPFSLQTVLANHEIMEELIEFLKSIDVFSKL